MKKRLLAIVCTVAILFSVAAVSASALASWVKYDTPSDIDYSFVAFGDMQSITWTDNRYGTTYVKSAFDWILNNKESRKIEYVFGLGDTIDTLTTYNTNVVQGNGKTQNVNEWILATDQFHRLDGIIPYTVIRGNHDDEGGYHTYVCTDNYTEQMDGFYYDPTKPATLGNSMSNHYRKITIGGTRYLMLSLDYLADNNVIAWANQVISDNPSYRVIASVHAYLDGTNSSGVGKLVSSNDGFLKGSIGAANADNSQQVNTDFDGKKLWTQIFSRHANMFMVLCGHDAIPTPVHNVRTGIHGNNVIEILTDTSKYDLEMNGNNYGGSMMMMLNFREDTNEIQIEYFSPSRALSGQTSYHLANEQIHFTYSDLEIEKPKTQMSATVRISEFTPGLRFTTTISEATVEDLVSAYGEENVSVGTLIAPAGEVGMTALTHSFGTSGVDYIDVVGKIDAPYASEGGKLTYAGSISNIKQENLDKNFKAVGYIAYRESADSAWTYIYSKSSVSKNIDSIATAALADTSAGYSEAELEIIKKLTVAYYE